MLLTALLSMGAAGSGLALPMASADRLPWDCGREFRVTQGNDGNSWDGRDPEGTHAGIFALDFPMDEATKVRAARAGVVRSVVSDSNDNADSGRSRESGPVRANVVEVEHEDGTVLRYLHFQHRGVVVQVNDRVEAGELLGFSGHTGVSAAPHLHLELRDSEEQTIPLVFEEVAGDGQPQPGMRYRSQNLVPGQDPASCASGLEARYGSPRMALTTASPEEMGAVRNDPALTTVKQFGPSDTRWIVYITRLSVDPGEEWGVIWRDSAGREVSRQRITQAAPQQLGHYYWVPRNALPAGGYRVELSVAGQALKSLSLEAGEERIDGPLANMTLMPILQTAELDADAEAVAAKAQHAERRAARRAGLPLPLTGNASDWSNLGIQPSAVGTPQPDLPASADLQELTAVGSSTSLFIQLTPRDPAPEPAVSYSLRLDADGSGANWFQLLVEPGRIWLRDWRGAPGGTTPPARLLSGSLFELERGSGPGGSLQLHLDLAALENQLPVRVWAQSYRTGTSEVYQELPWGRVQLLVP